jgi:hypothetical protein
LPLGLKNTITAYQDSHNGLTRSDTDDSAENDVSYFWKNLSLL